MSKNLNEDLLEAAGAGDLARIKLLVEQGADIFCFKSTGSSLLYFAVVSKNIDLVLYLLDQGLPPDHRLEEGSATGLMQAAAEGGADLVQLLLDRGADPSLRGGYKNINAYDWAVYKKQQVCADILRNAVKKDIVRNIDEVVINSRLNDRTMQEVFNFKSRQRVTLIRRAPTGRVEAMSRDAFSRLDDDEIRPAFDIYKQQGGALTEQEVFNNFILKPSDFLSRKSG